MIIEPIIALLAPHTCIGCATEGSLVCDWCREAAIQPLPSRCYRCHSLTQDSATCKKCRHKSDLAHVWVRTEYTGLAKLLVQKLKFERARAGAEVIARFMDEALPYSSANTIITFAPTATSRRRIRGYDQAELIARELARRRKLPFKTLLHRRGHSRQVGSDKLTRQTQLKDAFYPSFVGMLPKGCTVLIIDDIVTSGATLESAARFLKKQGAKIVCGAVFAQKI
jgi:ComF family protein